MKALAIAGWFCCIILAGSWGYVFYQVNTADELVLTEPVRWIALAEFTGATFVTIMALVLLIVAIFRRYYD